MPFTDALLVAALIKGLAIIFMAFVFAFVAGLALGGDHM